MRYFIETAYVGLEFSGFQIQNNANTIQLQITNALNIFYKTTFTLTGSSRTDAQVNAYQNFFHFNTELPIRSDDIYNLNSILPNSIVIISISPVIESAHARFSAISRTYQYKIHTFKSPFSHNNSYFFPYKIDALKLSEISNFYLTQTNFYNFCKSNTQVNNYQCTIFNSNWQIHNNNCVYTVEANRFLRGMVKALVGTSLLYASHKISSHNIETLFTCFNLKIKANFTPPGYALYLKKVLYPENIFLK